MTRPLSKPEWIPNNDPDKIIAPSSSKQSTGWLRDEKPPFQFWNWFWNLVSQWITHVEAISIILGVNADNTEAADVTITGGNIIQVQVVDSLIAECDIENTPIGLDIPAPVAATLLYADTDPITEEGVGNRAYNDNRYGIQRVSYINITKGVNPGSLLCSVQSVWRGISVPNTDNILKNSGTGFFSLNAAGSIITIDADAFNEDPVIAVVASSIVRNGVEPNLYAHVYSDVDGNALIEFWLGGSVLTDITTLIEAGEFLVISFTYITPSV